MKILVAVKRVIDYNVQVRVKEDGSGVVTENVKMSSNPPDDNAIEEAVKIKEAGKATEIVAITVGEEKSQETVRKALAVGADRGILIKTEGTVEPLAVAKVLQKIVDKEKPDLVFMGKQAIDDDCNQTGQMLSALLNWPQATFASKIEIKDKVLEVELPISITLKVTETDPGVKGDTASGGTKPAILETGAQVMVPLFISVGEMIKVDTRNDSYLGRDN